MPTHRNILVFGAFGFVGKAWCTHLEQNGYRVLRSGRSAAQKPDLLLDFCEPGSIEQIDWQKLPPLDGVYFLQGINPSKGVHEITEEDFHLMLRVNLVVPTLLLQHLKESLQPHASVVFISSVARRKGSYDPSYAAAKSGLTGLLHSLANAMPNARFNALSLGLVEHSPVYEGMMEDFRNKHRSRMRNGELIQLEDVIRSLDFLQQNSSIHRETLALEGGFQA